MGDTVSVMAPNCPKLLEAHYGVPMAGAAMSLLLAMNVPTNPEPGNEALLGRNLSGPAPASVSASVAE